MTRRIPTLALALAGALASATGPARAAGAASAVVARVFGQEIVEADLVLAEGTAPALDAEGRARARREALRARIWLAVFDDYARQRQIEPTESEVISQIENQRRLSTLLHEENQRRRAEVAVELAAADLDAARRAALERELGALDLLLAHEAARKSELEDPERRTARDRAELRVAREWVRKWKFEQALYREFGGRIAFQQAGWEPVDAYRKTLERYEANGSFTLVDPAARQAVYGYFDHDFVYLEGAPADFYFERPWWERTPEEMRAAGF